MKLFRDFLEECIGKKVVIDFKYGEGNAESGKILEVQADFVKWQSVNTIFLYIPIDCIATIGVLNIDTQNSKN